MYKHKISTKNVIVYSNSSVSNNFCGNSTLMLVGANKYVFTYVALFITSTKDSYPRKIFHVVRLF